MTRSVPLEVFLARCGLGNRRECARWIREGRVHVRGELVTRIGYEVDPSSASVEFDSRRVHAVKLAHYLFHKPKGVLSTTAPGAGKTRVLDSFAHVRGRLYVVFPLDAMTEGLVLVTTDCELAERFSDPEGGVRVPRTYRARCRGRADPATLREIRHRILAAEGRSSPAVVRAVEVSRNDSFLELVVHETRNWGIRQVLARYGLPVRSLKRIKIGPLSLKKIPRGGSRPLFEKETGFLYGLAEPTPGRRARRKSPSRSGTSGRGRKS